MSRLVCTVAAGLVAAALGGLLATAPSEPPSSGGEPHKASRAPAAPAVAAAPCGADRNPLAAAAEAAFFEALNHDPSRRAGAIESLAAAYAADPADRTTALHLGLAHLWCAAERRGDATPALDRLVLAEHYLVRAQTIRPDDQRIPSWLYAAQHARARLEGDAEAARAAAAGLEVACDADPCFHSVAFAILAYDEGPASPRFQKALAALRTAAACAGDRPATVNTPRWPHNLEGFSLALAEYELAAGNRDRAEMMLMFIGNRESAADWPLRARAEDRLDRLADLARAAAAGNPPDFVLASCSRAARGAGRAGDGGGGVACVVCHQAGP